MQLLDTQRSIFVQQSQIKNIFCKIPEKENTKYVEGFSSIVSAHLWAFPKYEDWLNSLSKKEYSAFYDYASKAHKPINDYLKGITTQCSNENLKKIDVISSVVRKTSTPENVIVYRGSDKFSLGLLDIPIEQLEGKIIEEKGFMSTSMLEKIGIRHSKGILMKIKVPKGAPGAYIGTISEYPEAELLFDINSRIRIESVTQKDNNNLLLECKLLLNKS